MSPCGENSKPICHGSPHPLRELALTKTSLNIWLHKFDKFYKPGTKSSLEITTLDFRSEKSALIPLQINKIIDARMYYIAIELDSWVTYATSAIKYLSYDQIYTRFNLVVFGGNCKIHFRDTIANFLEDDSLHNKTRFKIACVNCIEEKIDFFWPLVSSTLSISNFRFDDDFMLCYWVRRKKGELHEIPFGGFTSIERLMIKKCRQNRIHLGVEYFLKLLNRFDQLVELSKLVDAVQGFFRVNQFYRYEGLEVFTNIFLNIDGPTQRMFFDKYSVNILDFFLVYLKPVEYTVQIFLYIKDFLTFERYCDMLKLYFKFLDDNPYYSIPGKKLGFWFKQIDVALEQIWLNTPPHLKKYAMANLSTILNHYDRYYDFWLPYFGHDFKFLLAVISNGSVQLRNDVWMRYWPEWIDGVSPSQFQELMGLYLIETEVIEEFKSTFTYTQEFQECCDGLICKGQFIKLDEFLNSLYPSNPKLILNIKKHILTNETDIFYEELEAVEKYAKYIDNLFSNDVAADFKNQIIFSGPVMEVLLYPAIKNDSNENLSEMKSIVSLFVSPEKHAEIKKKFLELFRVMVTSGKLKDFNESLWGEFVLWCLDNDEQRVEDFMKSVQIDVVFRAALLELLEFENSDFNTSFNRFLVWFFKSKSTSVNYIREKVEYYERMNEVDIWRIFRTDKQIVIDSMKNEVLKKVITLKW